jgi:xanthine dehydrogenase YagR molybdenum-binding subunit
VALHENSVSDTPIVEVANHDLAEYHIPVNADVDRIEALWLDEHDPYVNVMGSASARSASPGRRRPW